jgi:hypothetical protein
VTLVPEAIDTVRKLATVELAATLKATPLLEYESAPA